METGHTGGRQASVLDSFPGALDKILDMLKYIIAKHKVEALVLERKVLSYTDCEADSAIAPKVA